MLAYAESNAMRPERREVTLLFADMRGFTELAESLQIDPLVCELLAHVMDCLADAVANYDGFIVDYYGDGLAAMWNAPADQPQHAELACRAALDMLTSLPAVSKEWMSVTQTELRLGVGIHTGSVQVGNAGSARKAKYGPRGPNVNLASRVESATKELGVPLIITRSTAERLSDQFMTNRVCRAQMPGLQEPVDLFAVRAATNNEPLAQVWHAYDRALKQFESGNLEAAADILASIDEEEAAAGVPWNFLTERVRNEQGRKLRRRTSDKPPVRSDGVVQLVNK